MYCSQAQVESYLGRDLTDDEAALFSTLESGVEDFVDTYTGRTFDASRNTATTQFFDGGGIEIFFDTPLQTITSIESVDPGTGFTSTLPSDNYVLYPYNSTPKTSVMMRIGVFPWGDGNIKVTGTFGDYITPPSGIQLACTTICANYLNLSDSGDLKSETVEGYARTLNTEWNPIVKKLLDNYRRVLL